MIRNLGMEDVSRVHGGYDGCSAAAGAAGGIAGAAGGPIAGAIAGIIVGSVCQAASNDPVGYLNQVGENLLNAE